MGYFVVINEQGPSWADDRPMREQEGWAGHASFVNSLFSSGLVVLAGPIGSGKPHRALLIVHAADEPSAVAQLLQDPWMRDGILRLGVIEPWTILVSDDRLDRVLAEVTRSKVPS